MKLKRLFACAFACAVFVATSCTKEDSVITDLTKAGAETTASEVAYISLDIKGEQALTKASESHLDKDSTISDLHSCSLIVLDGTKVVAAYDGLEILDGKVQLSTASATPFMFQVKAARGTTNKVYNVIAVANTAQTYVGLTTYDAIQAKLLNATDMNNAVKVGEKEITIPTFYPTVDAAKAAPVTAAITVKQIAARIELNQFNVAFKSGTKPVAVTLKSVTLVNQNIKSQTKVNSTAFEASTNTWGTTDIAILAETSATDKTIINKFNTSTPKPLFYTFPNVDPVNATALKVVLVYDNAAGAEEKEFTFIINRPTPEGTSPDFTNNANHAYIKSGYIYLININAALTSNSIECEALICVKDWVINSYDVEMNDI